MRGRFCRPRYAGISLPSSRPNRKGETMIVVEWRCEGADAKTGDDRVVVVRAGSAEEAEKIARSKGLLVATTKRLTPMTHAEALDSMVEEAEHSPSRAETLTESDAVARKPASMPYRDRNTPAAQVVPAYTGLAIGQTILGA